MKRKYSQFENFMIGDVNHDKNIKKQCRTKFKIAIFGASGFSREVADIVLTSISSEIVFIDLYPKSDKYFGVPVVPEKEIGKLDDEGFLFIIGVGDNRKRKDIYKKFKDLNYPNIIHSSASMGFKQYDMLKNKKGNIITAGVRFTNNIKIGNFGIYNLNSTIGHDCIIRDFVNISPGTNISGNVFIDDGAYIGTNASILQGESIDNKISIGRFATVGAGAVVAKDVLQYSTVVGIPAKPITKK